MVKAITDSFKLALAQLNPVVGDIDGNVAKARAARTEAAAKGADLVAFTELYLTGYPMEDLVLKPAFQQAAQARPARSLRATRATAARQCSWGCPGPKVLSSTTPWHYLDRGRIEAVRFKYNLPNYGVFDEKRVFAAGPLPAPIEFRGVLLGVPVCEDIWSEEVCRTLGEAGRWASHRAERLALLDGQAGAALRGRADARRRDRASLGLSQSGRRPGRACVRRRLVRAQCRRQRSPCRCRPGRRRWG